MPSWAHTPILGQCGARKRVGVYVQLAWLDERPPAHPHLRGWDLSVSTPRNRSPRTLEAR
eukprot:7021999-Pyramimonas_sp.AAC.1